MMYPHTYMRTHPLSAALDIALDLYRIQEDAIDEALEKHSLPDFEAVDFVADMAREEVNLQWLLTDRYGPFDVVAGQRSPWENIP